MPRILLTKTPLSDTSLALSPEDIHYLTHVLRLGAGDRFDVAAPDGLWRAELIDQKTARLIERMPARPAPVFRVALYAGALKGDKMDMVIQKATELGAARITPMVTSRSIVRDTRKLARWRKIALEASRQSGRPAPPDIADLTVFGDALASAPEGFLLYEDLAAEPLTPSEPLPAEGLISVFVGPEGGFAPDEVEAARSRGLRVRSLGQTILRAETAAIAAAALIAFLSNKPSA